MLLNELSQDELSSHCKKYVETLESWLRRLVNEELTNNYGVDYFNFIDKNKQRLINNKIFKAVINRYNQDRERYNNLINATTFEDLIDILCNPNHYKLFKNFFCEVYPNGENEVRFFLKKIKNIRNKLYHLNPISIREAEQLICYSNDIIESFKNNYIKNNIKKEYNSPEFIKFVDSFGNSENLNNKDKGICNSYTISYIKDFKYFLRPGDILSIEVFIDSTFSDSEYNIEWYYKGIDIEKEKNIKKINFNVQEEHVGETFGIRCDLISNKSWHRYGDYDDSILFIYKVLPPIK